MAGARSAGGSAGDAFGSEFSNRANAGMAKTDGSAALNKVVNSAQRAGNQAGDRLGKGVAAGMGGGATRGGNQIVAAAGSAGGRAAGIFNRLFNSGGGPSKMFISMALRIGALIPVIGALVGAISSLVSGFFAIGAAAGNAIYALSALPGILGAVIQGAGVAMVAFGGIGDAMGAGLAKNAAVGGGAATAMKDTASRAASGVKQAMQGVADAERNAARAIEDATRGVRDAKEALAETYRNAAQAQKDAIEGVQDAEEALADAHDNVRDAQEALTDARIEAKERLLDLQFAERGGVISEQRAIMALQDARYQLNATQVLPADNRIRQEAQLAFDEAALNLDMVREKNGDTKKDLKEIREEGIKGSDEVVSANEALVDAQDQAADAAEALADAIANVSDVQRDNSRAIRDSKEALGDAKQALADAYRDGPRQIAAAKAALDAARNSAVSANQAFAAGTPEIQAYQQAMEKLSPPAQRFVEFLLSISDRVKTLKTEAQRGLFPGLEVAISNLVYGPLFPALQKMMYETGKSLGKAAISISESLSSGPFVASFGRVTQQNSWIIEQLGKAAGNLARALFAMMDAARPLTRELVNWFTGWSKNLRVTTEAKNKTGELTKTFMDAGTQTKQLIRIFKNLWEGISDIGKIAAPSGQNLISTFELATERFANFTDTRKNRRMLREFFDNVNTNFKALSSLILVVGGAFARLGADPTIGKLAKQLEPVILNIEELITTMLDKVGPQLVDLVDKIVIAFTEISDSGAISVFLDTLTTGVDLLIGALQDPILGPALKNLIAIGGALYAISIIRKFPGLNLIASGIGGLGGAISKFGKGPGGTGPSSFFGGMKRIGSSIKNMPTAAKRIAGDIGAWFSLRAELVRNIATKARLRAADLASAAAEKTRLAATKLGLLIGAAQTKVAKAFQTVMKSSIVLKIKDTAITIGKTIVEKAAAAGTWAMAVAQKALNLAMKLNPIGIVIIAITALVAIFVLAYKKSDTFRKIVDKAFSMIKSAAKSLWNRFKDTVGAIVKFLVSKVFPVVKKFYNDVVRPAFQKIGSIVKTIWTKVIQPALRGLWLYITKVLIPVIKFLWAKVFKPYFEAVGKIVRTTWDNVVKPALTRLWSFVKNTLIPVIKMLWEKVVRPVFTYLGDKIKNAWENVIKPALTALKNMLETLKDGFNKAKSTIGTFWDNLRDKAKAPVRFIVETIYNNGIRKALNYLPGVDLPGASVSFATGGVMPGYTPGRDVHKFFSPTGGRLELSGGEAIMRPEFTRAVGGEKGVAEINARARRGLSTSRFHGKHADGGVYRKAFAGGGVWHPGTRSPDGADVLDQAWDINSAGGEGTPVPAFLSGIVSTARRLGDVSFGNYAMINHPQANLQTLYAHMSEMYVSAGQSVRRGQMIGREGDVGNSFGSHLHFEMGGGSTGVYNSGGSTGASSGPSPKEIATNKGKEEKEDWLDRIKQIALRMAKVGVDVRGMLNSNDAVRRMFGESGRAAGSRMIQYANEKIPNKIEIPKFPDLPFPDNPLNNPFDDGGVATGRGWMRKDVIDPERVLSPKQTDLFDRFIEQLENLDRRPRTQSNDSNDQINIDLHVPHSASADEVVTQLVYEIRRMKRGGKRNR